MDEVMAMIRLGRGDLSERRRPSRADPARRAAGADRLLRDLLRPLLGLGRVAARAALPARTRLRRRPRRVGAGLAAAHALAGHPWLVCAYGMARPASRRSSGTRPMMVSSTCLGPALHIWAGRTTPFARAGRAELPALESMPRAARTTTSTRTDLHPDREPDQALAQLEPLLELPTSSRLGGSESIDVRPARNNPRFKKLVEGTT